MDALRAKAVDAKIDNKMRSPNADDKLEATTARSIRGIVRDVDRKYGPNGSHGQIDIETNKFVIEVSNGRNAGKVSQVKGNLGNPKGQPVRKADYRIRAEMVAAPGQGVRGSRNNGRPLRARTQEVSAGSR